MNTTSKRPARHPARRIEPTAHPLAAHQRAAAWIPPRTERHAAALPADNPRSYGVKVG